MVIETNRLLLMPMTIDFIEGLINDDKKAYSLLDIIPSEEWPSEEIFSALPMIKESLSQKNGTYRF